MEHKVFFQTKNVQKKANQHNPDSQQTRDNDENVESLLYHNKSTKKTQRKNIKVINSYGPSFSVEFGSNLCFLNQCLHILFHCQFIYDWCHEKTSAQIKSDCLRNLYFISNMYYNQANNSLFKLDPAYHKLVEMCHSRLAIADGEMGDTIDTVEYILNEFQYETASTKRKYSSAFEIVMKYTNYYYSGDFNSIPSVMNVYNINDKFEQLTFCLASIFEYDSLKYESLKDTF